MTVKKKILIGCDAICDYVGVSRPLFYDFVKRGMPARLIKGRWFAHSDNLDDFFKMLTFYKEKNPPEDAE